MTATGVWVPLAFDPDQPRDEQGKWSPEGGGGDSGKGPNELWDRPSMRFDQGRSDEARAAFEGAAGKDGLATVDTWQTQMTPPAGTDEKMASLVDDFGRPNEGDIYRGDAVKGTPDEIAARLQGEDVSMAVSSFSTSQDMAASFATYDADHGAHGREGGYTVVTYQVGAGDATTLPIENLGGEPLFFAEHEEVAAAGEYTVASAEVTTGVLATEPDRSVVAVTLAPK